MPKPSFFYHINLFLRSVAFSSIMILATVVQSFVCIAISLFPLRIRYQAIINYLRFILWMLKIICRIDYQIEGLENIPHDRSGVILSKHQSTWETFFLPTCFYQPAIIVKRELLWIPFFGWGLATIDPIAINRSNASSAMSQIITKGKKCLSLGRWILLFPEGTRIPVGKVGHYRLGGARLAVATHAPVIPVAHNAGRFWPRRRFIKRPGTIRIMIGPVIETEGSSPEEVMAKTKEWIEQQVASI